jgi:hypothetical protein
MTIASVPIAGAIGNIGRSLTEQRRRDGHGRVPLIDARDIVSRSLSGVGTRFDGFVREYLEVWI